VSLAASDFLCFGELDLPLDPALTVVVGPNGAGKSSLVRILELALTALTTVGTGSPAAWSRMAAYDDAVRHGGGRDFRVAVTFRLTDDWEQQIISQWLVSAAASQVVVYSSSQPVDRTALDRQATAELLAEDLSGFMTARLVVVRNGGVTPTWAVGVEFDIGGATFTYGLHGPGASTSLWRGHLTDDQPTGGQGLRERFVVDGAGPVQFRFSLERLLPDSGAVMLDIQSSGGFLDSGLEFIRLVGGNPLSGRNFSLADALRPILNRGICILQAQRLPARVAYRARELTDSVDPQDPSAVPLELFQRRTGDMAERNRFDDCVELFKRLTGVRLDVRVRRTAVPGPSGELVGDLEEVLVEPVVIDAGFETPITMAGSGRWEALVLSSALTRAGGSVVVLDEPASNLHATLQRRVMSAARKPGSQLMLISHSPFMVPSRELGRIVRVAGGGGQPSRAHRFDPVAPSPGQAARHRQLLDTSADTRELLFAQAVILVEGDTELGCLPPWFDASQTAAIRGTLDGLNLLLHPVGADTAFGRYVELLEAFGVPWAIICDGPVLDPDRDRASLTQQLSAVVPDLAEGRPSGSEFAEWARYWETKGAFTLADQFGTTNQSGELEVFLSSVDSAAWSEATQAFRRSKVRAAQRFASEVACPPAVDDLYGRILSYFAP